MRKRHVENEDRRRFDLRDAGGWLGEIHRARAAQQLHCFFIHQLDLYVMLADFGAFALEAEHQVQARMHRRELRHPDVLEDAEHRHLARLIDQRIVGDDSEIEMHFATGTETFVLSQATVSAPGSNAMVSFSTGAASVSTLVSTRTRSCSALYSVPHCPVCLLMMSFQLFSPGSVYSVYLPAGTAVLNPVPRVSVGTLNVAEPAPLATARVPPSS